MVIVRTAHERTGDRAADILRLHGAKSLTNKAGPNFDGKTNSRCPPLLWSKETDFSLAGLFDQSLEFLPYPPLLLPELRDDFGIRELFLRVLSSSK